MPSLGLLPKSPVFFVPDYVTYVDPKEISIHYYFSFFFSGCVHWYSNFSSTLFHTTKIYSKGYDASNNFDEEVGPGVRIKNCHSRT